MLSPGLSLPLPPVYSHGEIEQSFVYNAEQLLEMEQSESGTFFDLDSRKDMKTPWHGGSQQGQCRVQKVVDRKLVSKGVPHDAGCHLRSSHSDKR